MKPIELQGLKLTILSPTPQKLNKLRSKYPLDSNKSLESEEDEKISEAVTQKQYNFTTKYQYNNVTNDKLSLY